MKQNNTLWVLGHKITPIETSGQYDMVIGETPPNVPGPPPHFHSGFNELFLVLQGSMEFVIDGKPVMLRQGDSIDLPANSVHTFKNAGQENCKWLNVHSPKGFWSFFQEMGISIDEPEAVTKSTNQSLIEKVMMEAANYDMHIKM